jgi:aspartyl-tRNA(Asn)/glutamyl-tRNA(Gln) amidotransferase subunit A
MEHTLHSASRIVEQVVSESTTAEEIVTRCLDSIKKNDGTIGAFLSVDPDRAIDAARKIDQRIRDGRCPGRLAGLPIAIKDGICTAGQPTTAGSRILEHFVPPYDATVVSRLTDEGAIVIGKTNMDEFAMGSSTENSYFGPTRNPWNTDRVPGGSSGGSAACIAADFCPAAIGSDTGGSIRQPAAFCGITGLKPTYGRVSRFGLIAFASSLDQIGPMTRSAKDAALLMSVISGHDPNDSTSARIEPADFMGRIDESIAGLRIGVCREHFEDGLDPQVEQAVIAAVDQFRDLGAEVVDVDLPNTRHAIATYYVIAPCEASSNLARFDGVRHTRREMGDDLEEMYGRTRRNGFGAEVRRRIMIGTYALSSGYYDAYYLQASKVRRLIKQDYDRAFEKADLLLGPTTPTPAFCLGEHTKDPLEMYLADVYTVSANLAGIPAISLPCGFADGDLPIGLQLQAPSFEELNLLRAGHQYQQKTDWHLRRPFP